MAGGLFLPLACLWAWEERLRARELRLWRQQLAEARAQAQPWGGDGGARPEPLPPGHTSVPQPLPFAAVAAWLVASCWALWLLLEAVFL